MNPMTVMSASPICSPGPCSPKLSFSLNFTETVMVIPPLHSNSLIKGCWYGGPGWARGVAQKARLTISLQSGARTLSVGELLLFVESLASENYF